MQTLKGRKQVYNRNKAFIFKAEEGECRKLGLVTGKLGLRLGQLAGRLGLKTGLEAGKSRGSGKGSRADETRLGAGDRADGKKRRLTR